jgi:uncharacterized protein involved in propanediol utilization
MTIASKLPQSGYGFASGHHGELIQGAFSDGGAIVRGLVTLPYPLGRSGACFVVSTEPKVTVDPAEKLKAARAAELTLAYLGRSGGGKLTITTDIPQRLGLGSSTADVVAAIRAVASAFDTHLSPNAIGQIAVTAERASDSIMFDRPVLFAHREGRILEHFDSSLPPLKILSVVCGSEVDTLQQPAARYSVAELHRFDELRDRLRVALRCHDAGELAAVTTESVRINQQHLPFPAYECLEEIGDETGALGIQASHSGAIVGVIYDALDPAVEQRVKAGREAFEESGETVGDAFTPTDAFTSTIETNQKEAV